MHPCTRGVRHPVSLRPLSSPTVGVALARGEVRKRINRSPNVEQPRIGIDVHRQVERTVPHGSHGGAGANANGGEVGSEGVAKGMNVDCSIPVIPLRDTRGGQIAIEDLDEVPRYVEQRRTEGQAHRHRLSRFGLQGRQLGGEELPQLGHEVITQRDPRPSAGLLVLGEQFGVRSGSVQRDLPDGQAGQFALSQAGQYHHAVDQCPFLAKEFQRSQAIGIVPQIPAAALGGGFKIVEGEISLAPRLSSLALGLGPVLALAAVLRDGAETGGGQQTIHFLFAQGPASPTPITRLVGRAELGQGIGGQSIGLHAPVAEGHDSRPVRVTRPRAHPSLLLAVHPLLHRLAIDVREPDEVIVRGDGRIVAIVKVATFTFTAFGAVVGFLVSPIGMVIAALGALGAYLFTSTEAGGKALGWFGEKFGQLKEDGIAAYGGIVKALKSGDMGLAAKILWLTLKMWWKRGVGWLTGLWVDFKNYFIKIGIDAFTGLLLVGSKIWGGLEAAWAHTVAFFGNIWDGFVYLFKATWTAMVKWARKAWEWIKSLFGKSTKESRDRAFPVGLNSSVIWMRAPDGPTSNVPVCSTEPTTSFDIWITLVSSELMMERVPLWYAPICTFPA